MIRDCYLLSASCYIRLEEYGESILFVNIILGVEPNCVKALFLRALAYEDMKQPENALVDFTRAHELSPADLTIKNYLMRCQQTVRSGRTSLNTAATAVTLSQTIQSGLNFSRLTMDSNEDNIDKQHKLQ